MTSPSDGRNAGTFGALFGLLLFAGMLMGLTALVLPQAAGLVIVFGGFVGIFALHYLLWGCWLSRMLIEEERKERARAESERTPEAALAQNSAAADIT